MDYKTKKKTAKKKTRKNFFLFKLVWRTTLFLSSYLAAMFFFYICGNYQVFLDSTQRFILLLCALISIALLILSLSGVAISIFQFIYNKRKRAWIFFTLYTLIAIFSTVVFLIARTVSILSTGIHV
ncbi:MAG: hypothetical protein K6E22_13980 [Treponema sp.]|nr:hypothetical protein [Treponema sp.]